MSKKSSAPLTEVSGKTPVTPTRPIKPRTVTLRVTMTAADRDAAEKLARMRTLQGLDALLGDLVADIATAYERPGSWEAGRVWDWLDSHYPPTHFLRLERDGKEGAKNGPL